MMLPAAASIPHPESFPALHGRYRPRNDNQRPIRRFAASFLLASLLLIAATSAPAAPSNSKILSPEDPVVPWPGSARPDLAVPDTVWKSVLAGLDLETGPLGYSGEQMAAYGRDLHLMRTVANLFRDARTIPRFSGKLSADLMASIEDPAELLRVSYLLVDVSAGRLLPMPEGAGWDLPGLTEDDGTDDALEAWLASHGGSISDQNRVAWRDLPEADRRLVVRLLVAASESIPWIRLAVAPVFAPGVGSPSPQATSSQLYKFASAPWTDERLGQAVTLNRRSLEALRSVDREYLAFGSVLFATYLTRSLDEHRPARSGEIGSPGTDLPHARKEPPPTGPTSAAEPGSPTQPLCRLETEHGSVRIFGPGPDWIVAEDGDLFVLDLGGDDRWVGGHAVSRGPERPLSLVIDLEGDDIYDGQQSVPSLGCGLFGLGVLIDVDGNDRYDAQEAGLGAAWYGTGVLLDLDGKDAYTLATHHGQGQGWAGVGILADRAGNDRYTCGSSAQGFGETLGAGILLDAAGDDEYLARDDGNPSELYLGQSVSMSQGVGQGRRADLGDGHSLAGGLGVLVDGSGNDRYHASAWSHGAGYWWAVGILEDLGGDDTYRDGKYSLGAAAHFAIGCQVDLAGDDLYNVGNETAVNQFQGHARDGSIGVSIDGDGDDQYLLRSHCGGSGDLASLGFFWDRRGEDTYTVRYEELGTSPGWSDTPPMGTTTVYEPMQTFRDDLNAYGVFLDTGGTDRYLWAAGPAAPESAAGLVAISGHASEGRVWILRRGPRARGFGLDGNWYGDPGR